MGQINQVIRGDAIGGAGIGWVAALLACLVGLSMGIATGQAGTLMVVDPAAEQVSFIDTESGKIRHRAATGKGPRDIAVSSDGALALVANFGDMAQPGSSLTVLDVARGEALGNIDLAPHSRPFAVRWLPGEMQAVVSVQGEKMLARVDVAGRKLLPALGDSAASERQLALSNDGRYAFVGDPTGGPLTRIDLSSGREAGTSKQVAEAQSIALSPDGELLWVTDRGADLVHVLQSDDLSAVVSLVAGNMPMGVALTPNGRYAMISNALSADVIIFNTRSYEQAKLISTRTASAEEALEAMTGEELFTGTRLGHISIPVGLVPAEDGLSVYVMNNFSGEIVQYDIFTGVPIRSFQGSRAPGGMAYSPLTGP